MGNVRPGTAFSNQALLAKRISLPNASAKAKKVRSDKGLAMYGGEFRFKCFRLFLPVVGLAVGLALTYSLFNWLSVAGTGYLPLDEQLVDDWLPLAIAVILVIAWITPAINTLRFNPKRNGAVWYMAAAIAAIAVPTIVAQNFVVRASGTLTHVADASQIASGAATKYYSANAICLDHGDALAQVAFETLGSRNDTLEFHIYVAAPLCGEDIRAMGQKSVWIGVAFNESVSNRLPMADKQARFQQFANRSQQEFNLQDGSHYQYYELAPINFERRNLAKALSKAGISPDNAIFLIPHTEPFDQRTGHWLEWAFISFGVGALAWLAMIAFRPVDAGKAAKHKSPSKAGLAKCHGIGWTLLVPTGKSWGLPVLFDVNIAVYLAMAFSGLGVISFQTDDLIAWGANYGPLLHSIGLLRLVSCQFVHAGLMHLVQNMYGLLIAGILLQPVLRNWGLVTAYLVCGLVGAITSAMHANVAGVGASGAIMGLWGAVLVLALFRDSRISQARGFIVINGSIFVGLTLIMGLAQPGIDNAAHLGGVAMGAVIGAALLITRDSHAVQRRHDRSGTSAAITDSHQPHPEVHASN
ncbi:MAG TPA: rhomboid family intramembrane serine protease [Rhizomicrobium sp.]|jgi:membrane associated rhomboid family serine protease|nr:rhomboid family intramembrane serine protease [Rhizomicrobium sp.]